MVTAVAPDEDIIEMGFDDYLVKPVTSNDLHAVVDRLLRRINHTDDVREFFALASKKAVLDAETTAAEREGSTAYAELERSLRRKSEELVARNEDLDPEGFEMLFYDLGDDCLTDAAS